MARHRDRRRDCRPPQPILSQYGPLRLCDSVQQAELYLAARQPGVGKDITTMDPVKHDYIVRPLPGCPPEIGRMLWQLEDTRRRTLRSLDKLPEGALDALPEGTTNTVGTILYHTALVESS